MRYQVQTPNHGAIEIEGPEGASDDQLKAVAAQELQSRFPKERFAVGVNRQGALGGVDAAVRGAANGYTGGLADRFAAAADAVVPLDKLFGNQDVRSIWDGSSLGDAYRSNLALQHATTSADNRDHPILSTAGNIAGAIGSPLSRLIGGGGFTRALANDALYGAVYGGAQADQGKEDDALVGGAAANAAGGLAGGALARVTGRALAPATSAAVQRLREAGVPLTIGQTLGGTAKKVEDMATSVPGLGDLINRGRRASIEGFNRAAVDNALSPIDRTLPGSVKVGRSAAEFGQKATSAAYDNALQAMSLLPDSKTVGDLTSAFASAKGLPDAQRQVFDRAMEREVAPFMQGTALDGAQIQALKRGLDSHIAAYSGEGVLPADALVRQPLQDVRDAIMGGVERQSPEGFANFQNANEAYSRMQRINDATAKMRSDKEFTPLAFAGAVNRRGYGTTTAKVARGDAKMQDLADAASEVLPSQYPDSGSTGRYLLAALGAQGLGAVSPMALGAASIGAVPHLPGLNRLIETAIAGERPAALRGVGAYLRGNPRLVGAVAAPYAFQEFQGR